MHVLSTAPSSIQLLDDWMTKEVDFKTVKVLTDLGFKQLNDLLFYKYSKPIAQRMMARQDGDDGLLKHYESLEQLDFFASLTALSYLNVIQNQLRQTVEEEAFNWSSKRERAVLFQNLIMIAFTLERWGQYLLRRVPGQTVCSVYVYIKKPISLHDFLIQHIGNYNTLERFALRSISEIEGLYVPMVHHDKLVKGELITALSPYVHHSGINTSRFPSILKLDDFPLVIKKGELLAQGYNMLIVELMKLLRKVPLDHSTVIHKVLEITELFQTGIRTYKAFLKTPYFNEDKFIFILRQHTVELSWSPCEWLFEDLQLTKSEKRIAKGIVNSYLTRISMSRRERSIFLKQILVNESIIDAALFEYLASMEVGLENTNITAIQFLVNSHPILVGNPSLKGLIIELLTQEELGVYRLQYALQIAQDLLPAYASTIANWIKNETWLQDKLAIIMETNYHLPPSGANSIAYFGPDMLFGHDANIVNYTLHMINRLNVMIPADQKRFWELRAEATPNLTTRLTAFLDRAGYDGTKASIEAQLNTFSWLKHYVKLYDSFALLTSTHDGIIEKYIRRLSQSMKPTFKEKLVSSPDHGTTYMKPKTVTVQRSSANFPSLDAIAQIRRNHLLKQWVKPVKVMERSQPRETKTVNWFYTRGN